ncbi:MAG: 16S rRNA (cytosine(1402)-N(4))-methyltransferase RsmH [Planctomycetaceae bacterium]|nr:16S rRNA (cytosine(1402)-N(4))-methyltransferase RsmH [Planctomycetaceae bacterium]
MTPPDNTSHRPVLLRETIAALDLKPGLNVVDGTVGAGGHSAEILKRILPGGKLIGLDRDDSMLQRARTRLAPLAPEAFELLQASYADLETLLPELGLTTVDRLLVDLGLSSDQLADRERGFGFATQGSLDMRFDTSRGKPVHEWLNRADIAEITTVLTEFGEEPQAARIAQAITEQRRVRPILRASDLVALIEQACSSPGRRAEKSHPATRTFQALRIFINAELEHLKRFMTETAPACLKAGGILAVITFHSLEDRLVKQALADRAVWEISSKKPLIASPLEIKMNPRSRSAKLRIGIRAKPEIDHISGTI